MVKKLSGSRRKKIEIEFRQELPYNLSDGLSRFTFYEHFLHLHDHE